MIKKAIKIYKDSYKEEDYPWARYTSRPFAALFLAMIDGIKITPNQLTLISLPIGMAGIAAFAFYPGTEGLWIAWLLTQLCLIFDGMDGMMARSYKMHSPVGLKFDFLIDEIRIFFLYPAIGYRLYVEYGYQQMWPLYLVLIGTPFVASGLVTTYFMRSPEYTGKKEHSARSFPKGFYGLILRFFSLILNYPNWILIPVIFNRMDIFLIVSEITYFLYFCYAFTKISFKVGSYSHYEIYRNK
jgi:phosphatidylglycerophosphate synthase